MAELIRLTNLGKTFPEKNGPGVTILRDINLVMEPGQTVCVVGESGCGKTTLGRIIAGLSPYSAGSLLYKGNEVSNLSGDARSAFRKQVQLIHQNPYESLNPAMMVYDMIANPIKRHEGIKSIPELYKRVTRLLEIVGLTPVSDFVDKYPAFLSGGQRQRVSIARVLAMDPELIVVDEATSMIDTSLRISLLGTLKDIQQEFGVSYFFITHDLALGRYFAREQRIMVMYLGRVVETAPTDELIDNPLHPYTKAVLSAARGTSGILEKQVGEKYELSGADIPSFKNMPTGCPLHPRCPQKIAGLCEVVFPEFRDMGNGHIVACHLYKGGV